MQTEDHGQSPTGSGGNYEVGYRKPPKHTQFRAGQSGNASGRRKGMRNLMTDVRRTLKVPVKVKDGGQSRKVSTQEGALMLLREKALKGDARALDRLIELALRFNNDAGETGSAQALCADDQAILDSYTAEIAAAAKTSTTAVSRGDQTSDVDPGPGREVPR
jgi:hypothetical protein